MKELQIPALVVIILEKFTPNDPPFLYWIFSYLVNIISKWQENQELDAYFSKVSLFFMLLI
jgi:hypothetical protein